MPHNRKKIREGLKLLTIDIFGMITLLHWRLTGRAVRKNELDEITPAERQYF